MDALAQAAAQPQQQPSQLAGALAPRVYRNGAWRGGRRRSHGFGAHREPIETGAYGPPPVAGPIQQAAASGSSSGSSAGGSFGLPLMFSGNN